MGFLRKVVLPSWRESIPKKQHWRLLPLASHPVSLERHPGKSHCFSPSNQGIQTGSTAFRSIYGHIDFLGNGSTSLLEDVCIRGLMLVVWLIHSLGSVCGAHPRGSTRSPFLLP